MKTKLTRGLSLLLAFILLAGLLPTAAFAADSADRVISAEVELVSLLTEAETYTDTCYYSDGWFLEDSSRLNRHLATLSSMMSGVAFSCSSDGNGTRVLRLLKAFGFDAQLNRCYAEGESRKDSMGCAIGRKTITDSSGKEYTLLAVIPRNAGHDAEWEGDFNVGSSGIHAGFQAARDEMLRYMKAYMEENGVSGDVKVWCPGYSRGGAAANLLGGFLTEDSGYFGDGIRIAPENVFIYTIAAPMTLPGNVTRGEALSVAGAEEAFDTDVPAYVYDGADAGDIINPAAAQYGGIHNFIAAGDYFTKLPPAEWGFTRYGETVSVEYGSEKMLHWLGLISEDAAVQLARYGGYSAPLPVKMPGLNLDALSDIDIAGLLGIDLQSIVAAAAATLSTIDFASITETGLDALSDVDLQPLLTVALLSLANINPRGLKEFAAQVLLEDAVSPEGEVYTVSTDTMITRRLTKALSMAGSRAELVADEYPEILSAAVLLYTTDWSGFYHGVLQANPAMLAMTAGLNYMAYALEQQRRTDAELTDEAGVSRMLLEILEYLGVEISAVEDYTVQQLLADVLASLMKLARENTDTVVSILPESAAALYLDFMKLAQEIKPATVDDVLCLLARFVTDHMETAEQLFSLAAPILEDLPEKYDNYMLMLRTLVSGINGQSYDATPEGTVEALLDLIRGCAEGFPEAAETMGSPDLADPAYVRYTLRLLATLAVGSKPGVPAAVSSLLLPELYAPELLEDLVGDLLDLIIEDGDGNRIPVVTAADATLAGLLGLGSTESNADLIPTLAAHPDALRAIAATLLFDPAEHYSFTWDVYNALTLAARFDYLLPAHYHELYTAWLKTMDNNYLLPDSANEGGHSYGGGSGGSDADKYPVEVKEAAGGAVKSDLSGAGQGDKVLLTVTPDKGYVLKGVTVTDADGRELLLTDNGNGVYSFTMPAGKVTVKAVFAPEEASEESAAQSCPKDETCPLRAFTDLDPTAWYHDGIQFVLEKGIMQGYGDGLFGPNDSTTRAMMAQLLWNLEGRPETDFPVDYADVREGDWFAPAVRWTSSAGILEGYGNGCFGPKDPLTREQMVTILYRYAKYKGVAVEPDANILDFGDVSDVSSWAVEAFRWAVQVKLVDGVGDNKLAPRQISTRAMIATVIMRYFALSNG